MKRFILKMMLMVMIVTATGCYSCKTWNDFWGTGPVEPYAAHKFFWDEDCRPMVVAAPKPAPMSKPKPMSMKAPGDCGPYTVSRTYPCGDCGIVRLEKVMPKEVQLNALFDYEIMVMNLTNMELADVVVTEVLDENFEFERASPTARIAENKLLWVMDSMVPRETQKIKVTGMAKNAECLKHCARITYVIPACANVVVVQPQLRLTKTAPAEVLLCDPIPVKMVVTNTGSGSAGNVKITDMLPTGLTTSDGRRNIALDAGTLAAGQSKEFSMTLKASKTGRYVNKAVATSDGGLRSEASTTTVVRQPVLAIAKSGPMRRYLGRSITYDIMVSNKGDAVAKDVVVVDTLPAGAKFVSATGGGRLAAGKVTWKMASLAAGSSRKVSVTVMPEKSGTYTDVATATATCAEGVRASAQTVITGIAAVLLEVIDIDDPIELGANDTYVITVTNQGSSDGTNISIVCTLEDNMQYVSSSGATTGRSQANQVVFQPLAKLAPKAKAEWRVVVKAVKPGDVRFKVTMNTDQIQRPVEETEATHLYE
ncbi:MAG: DUF11 domain-containing protein [Phycisphaerales bacterium]|jgi:uncharacterized repeat protein (TIGR01451 family)